MSSDMPRISSSRMISRHAGATVAEGIFDGARVAIKSFNSDEGFSRELAGLSAAHRAGAPVPGVLWAGRYDKQPLIIQEWIEGTPGLHALSQARGRERLDLVELAAAAHARMSLASLEAVGVDTAYRDCLKALSQDHEWPQLLASQLHKWLGRITPTTVDSLGGREWMNRLLMEAAAAPADIKVVVHADYSFRNLIISSAQQAIIIDFGTALAGDPRYDLAKIIWRDLDGLHGKLARRFVRCWAEQSGLEVPAQLLNVYVACHALAAIAWVEKQPSTSLSDRKFRQLALDTLASLRKPTHCRSAMPSSQ